MKTNFGEYTKTVKDPSKEYLNWKNTKSEEDFATLLTSLNPTVSSALMSFAGGDPTLKTRAKIITAQAINTFDPEKGATLKTHVYNNLKQLYRYKSNRASVIHTPENIKLDSYKIHKFNTEFIDKHGRDPSIEEISDSTGLSKNKIKKANIRNEELSSSQTIGETGDLLSTEEKDIGSIWNDYIYFDLDPISKKIFEWTTGYGNTKVLPKKEIATKLNMSPAAVSSRINTILKRMQQLSTIS